MKMPENGAHLLSIRTDMDDKRDEDKHLTGNQTNKKKKNYHKILRVKKTDIKIGLSAFPQIERCFINQK